MRRQHTHTPLSGGERSRKYVFSREESEFCAVRQLDTNKIIILHAYYLGRYQEHDNDHMEVLLLYYITSNSCRCSMMSHFL